MAPRPDVSEERKNQILEAALVVFAEKGFEKARMDDIVAESGLSKGTLYWYFKNKEDIIINLINQIIFRDEFKLLEAVAHSDAPAQEALTKFMETILADLKKIEPFYPIFYEIYAMATRSKVFKKFFEEYMLRYLELLTPIIAKGIEEGSYKDVDPETVAVALGGLIEGTLLLKIYSPEKIDPEKHIRAGFKYLLEGILTE